MKGPINRYFYGYALKTKPARDLCDGENTTAMHIDVDANEQALGEIVREAFTAGARWQLRESAKLSPHIAKFLEMVILLGPDSPRDAWLETTDSDTEGLTDSDDTPIRAELRDDIPF